MMGSSSWTTASAVVWALALGTSVSAQSITTSNSLVAAMNKPDVFQSQLHRCPAACNSHSPQDWTVYPSHSRLALCDQPMLFDMSIHSAMDNPTHKVRACTAAEGTLAFEQESQNDQTYDCGSASETLVSIEITSAGESTSNDTQVLTAFGQLQTYFGASADCTKGLMLGYYGDAVVGVYLGKALANSAASTALDQIISQVKQGSAPDTSAAQICGGTRDADHTAGVAVSNDLSIVQAALVSWSNGTCASGFDDSTIIPGVAIFEVPQRVVNSTQSNSTHTNSTLSSRGASNNNRQPRSLTSVPGLQARDSDYCTTQTVVSGDTCWSLATQACGITTDVFYEYNDEDICGSLQIGQKVCCTEGSLHPLPYDNGTCYTYTVQADDTCYDIGLVWSLTEDDVAGFNDGTTWGWSGCAKLSVGLNICLSSGYPPKPAELANALCGPQVPGTVIDGTITDASSLADLNPCPLNACCNIWGQCGIDSEFCTESEGPTGNPGTSDPDVYGCISNCGTDITNNADAPADGPQRVGYYETFNWGRECLHMRAAWSNTNDYTHMHWAFGTVGEDMSVFFNDSYNQWEGFMSLDGVKKVVSFGGWGFSTDVGTYDILRNAMSDDYRDTFISNIVAFVEKTGIDGIDFDWEYPGAPDIPGIPAGLESDTPNYLTTLKALREALPEKYSISIAAPASYWYLKAFPIDEMSEVVDYIVYMAYDLHGQWDFGNSYAQSGCESGNCLRSHVNQTEVMLALAMITKAGVSSTKVMVGESSYGRSFNMAAAGCTGPDCFFTGTNSVSDATPGRCTGTGGYISNAEINELLADSDSSITTWYDEETASDYMVYDDLQWVAYMSNGVKEDRRQKWLDLNFAGTIDWAVDLQNFTSADTVGPTGDYDEDSCINVFDDMIWNWVNPAFDAPIGCTNVIQASPLPAVVTLTAYTTITMVSGGSVSTSQISTTFSVSEVSYQPFTLASTDTEAGTVVTYNPVPRVTPDPAAINVPAGWTVTSASGGTDSASTTTQIVGLPDATSTTSTTDAGGFVYWITWSPTISYSLPSIVTTKIPAPATIPTNENDPTPTPDPGVTDCTGSGCTQGTDCTTDDCTRGGDCTGPDCTRGGNCVGSKCLRGGQCIGAACTEGGDCEGDECVEGGGCSGSSCTQGGGCSGSNCNKGGGCVKTLLEDCSSGGCTGYGCNSCTGMWCGNKVTITIQPGGTPVPTPSPTCLVGCPTLPACPGGGTSCNQPCNLIKCAPGQMPTGKACTTYATARDCTEFVSSTAVETSPTTSWSTTTRTHCGTVIDCDAQDKTVTSTVTTDVEADPTASVETTYDYDETTGNDDFDEIEDDFDDWLSSIDTLPTSTTSTSTTTAAAEPTETVDPTDSIMCGFWDDYVSYLFEIANIWDWATEDKLKEELDGCGSITNWDYQDNGDGAFDLLYFNIDFFIKSGCIERAIVSAGGPEIECDGQGYVDKKRSTGARQKVTVLSKPVVTAEKNQTMFDVYDKVYDDLTAEVSKTHNYEPMHWDQAQTTA